MASDAVDDRDNRSSTTGRDIEDMSAEIKPVYSATSAEIK